MRKINTKQLTQIKSVIKNGKKRFYFWYYCPDLQKDRLRKFANTEAEARVLREKIKEKQVLGASSPVHGLTFNQLKESFLAFQKTRGKNREIKHSYLGDMKRRLNYFETVLGADTYIKDLTRQQITDAVYNNEGAKTPKTKLEYFVSLNAMLSFGAEEGLIFDTQINLLMSKKARPKQKAKAEQRIPCPNRCTNLYAHAHHGGPMKNMISRDAETPPSVDDRHDLAREYLYSCLLLCQSCRMNIEQLKF